MASFVNSANSETENLNESYYCHCTCVFLKHKWLVLHPTVFATAGTVWSLEILVQRRMGSKAWVRDQKIRSFRVPGRQSIAN